jgi:hypothetical protein
MLPTVEELNKALATQTEELSRRERENETLQRRLADVESTLADTEARRRTAVLERHIERKAFRAGMDVQQIPLAISYLIHPNPGDSHFDVDDDDTIVHRTATGVRSSLSLSAWFAEQKLSNPGLFRQDAPSTQVQTSVAVLNLSPSQKMELGRKLMK